MIDKEYLKDLLQGGLEFSAVGHYKDAEPGDKAVLELPEAVEIALMILLRASYGYDCVARDELDDQIAYSLVNYDPRCSCDNCNRYCDCC